LVIGGLLRVGSQLAQRYGVPAIGSAITTLKRYDVRIHTSLYGRSGGRGVRHGRDIGSAAAGIYQGSRGDDLDIGSRFQPEYSSRPKSKAYRGHRYGGRSSRRRKYCNPRPKRPYSRSR